MNNILMKKHNIFLPTGISPEPVRIADYEKAYGDQCENCGTSLSPLELINPKSALSGNVPVLKETKHWYLPLDQYEDWLNEWIIGRSQR